MCHMLRRIEPRRCYSTPSLPMYIPQDVSIIFRKDR
nr:unnamed protein product [Callosobruchus chinensis]